MKSEIGSILKRLKGTEEDEILREMESVYGRILGEQARWYKDSHFACPGGCGKCCECFEPDLLEGEALYLAAWLLEHQPKVAANAACGKFPFPSPGRCPLFDPDSPFHCSVYPGRALICRLFGASGSRNKAGDEVFRPCKFYPADLLSRHIPPLSHRQYTRKEMLTAFGAVPPVMSDLSEESLSFTPDDDKTELLRTALPKALCRLLLILNFEKGNAA